MSRPLSSLLPSVRRLANPIAASRDLFAAASCRAPVRVAGAPRAASSVAVPPSGVTLRYFDSRGRAQALRFRPCCRCQCSSASRDVALSLYRVRQCLSGVELKPARSQRVPRLAGMRYSTPGWISRMTKSLSVTSSQATGADLLHIRVKV